MLQSRLPSVTAAAFLAFLASLGLAFPTVDSARAQAPGANGAQNAAQDAFAVRDVDVDVTAANPAAARDQALAEAQRKAFATLYRRLAPSGGNPPNVSDAQLAQMVQGFEIQRERSSAVRYVATLTIRFQPAAVRTLLQGSGVAILEPPSRPFLVLPVARVGGRPFLWEERTPWREAWENATPGGYIPIAVPPGDIADVAEVSAEEALSADRAAVEPIANRYRAGEVLVAVTDLPASGDPDPAAAGTMTLRRLRADAPPAETTVPIPAAPGRTAEQYMSAGVQAALARLEEDWKRNNAAPASREERRLRVSVPIGRLDDLVQTRQRLSSVPSVTGVEVKSLNRNQAEMVLAYTGDTDRLRTALAQRDLVLSQAPMPVFPPQPQPGLSPAPGFPAQPGFAGQPGVPAQPGFPAPLAPVPAEEVWQLRWSGAAAR